MGKPKADPNLAFLEQAAMRNAPISISKPEALGKEPMPRGRFLVRNDGVIIIENLQVPGRSVQISVGAVLEAFFQHEGRLFNFRARVLEMDTPVQLNGAVMVRGMKISAPTKVEAGNRRHIYRQSFASVNPPVGVDVWAVPRDLLTPEQSEFLGEIEEAEASSERTPGDAGEDQAKPDQPENNQLVSSNLVQTSVPGLGLGQLAGLMTRPPHWRGEIADASEFGVGLTVHDIVYSRLKVFQPLAIRFRLPEVSTPMEFLFEVRRVQSLKSGARLGGLLLVNAANVGEISALRELASFALRLQRERARSKHAG